MITPTEIKQKAENKYYFYLQSAVNGESFFPIVIPGNKKPDEDTVRFEKELTDLINHSKEKKGYGYTIDYQTVKTKKHGSQDIPVSISFQSESDYLKYIQKEKETERFKSDVARIISSFPELKDWIIKYPKKVIENDWKSLLKVCQYFKNTPNPQLYIRELPIQVHTKFIENNKGVIKELLDIILEDNIDDRPTRFEPRFHLKYDEQIVRFRILDKSISESFFSGVDDLSIPVSHFRNLCLPIQSVYVVENKINMLTFPEIKNSIVVWGHGFGVDIMRDVEWMKSKRIFYWGDLDAQGFQILSEIRTHFMQVESFLMDRLTFDKFFEKDSGTKTNVEKDLILTQDENEMFKHLKENNYRLEQEKIPFEYVLKHIPISCR